MKERSGFTQIYNSFLDSDLLTQYEKLVFIAIKSFADNKTKQAFPSLATISRITGTSVSQVRRSIARMKDLGILDVEHRRSEKWGNIQNLYTIHDDPKIWKVTGDPEEDLEAVAEEISDAKLIAELTKRGYEITKKEPASTADQSIKEEGKNKSDDISSFDNNKSKSRTGQVERYPMDFVLVHYDVEDLYHQLPGEDKLIQYVIDILYDTLNSTKPTIRVQKEERPAEVVAGRLLKLSSYEIKYVIEMYKAQTDRITHPKAYILTQLYEAAGQAEADVVNEVQNDISNGFFDDFHPETVLNNDNQDSG